MAISATKTMNMRMGVTVDERFSRTGMLLGTEAMEHLAAAHVIVFGVGGVGGFAAEALARAGIGHLDLVDDDVVGLLRKR